MPLGCCSTSLPKRDTQWKAGTDGTGEAGAEEGAGEAAGEAGGEEEEVVERAPTLPLVARLEGTMGTRDECVLLAARVIEHLCAKEPDVEHAKRPEAHEHWDEQAEHDARGEVQRSKLHRHATLERLATASVAWTG